MNKLTAYAMLPGLVVEVLGEPAIVESVTRGSETETVKLLLNAASFAEPVWITVDAGAMVTVLGTSPSLLADEMELFED